MDVTASGGVKGGAMHIVQLTMGNRQLLLWEKLSAAFVTASEGTPLPLAGDSHLQLQDVPPWPACCKGGKPLTLISHRESFSCYTLYLFFIPTPHLSFIPVNNSPHMSGKAVPLFLSSSEIPHFSFVLVFPSGFSVFS